MSFSGCTYPLLPVLLGSLGISAKKSILEGFLLGLFYVLGFAFVYSSLGVFAGLTGRVFGLSLGYPIMRMLAGVLFIFFGLAVLGVFNLNLKTKQLNLHLEKIKNPYFKMLVTGIGSGMVVSPCVSPVLGSLLVYISLKNNLVYGAMLIFSFSFGLGFIFILCSTFSGFIFSLPKPAEWIEWVRKISAFILILSGVYFMADTLMKGF